MTKKSLVILANSIKNHDRCVAGKEVRLVEGVWHFTDAWVRPVSANPATHGAVPTAESFCASEERQLKPLDIVTLEAGDAVPELGQPENVLYAATVPWTYEAYFDFDVTASLLDRPADVWLDPGANGTDKVTAAYTASDALVSSLMLIEPIGLRLQLTHAPDYNGDFKRKMSASFHYNGIEYSGLTVTDPLIGNMYSACYPERGAEPRLITLQHGDEYALCVSLAPPFGVNHTQSKLVAAIIRKR